MNHPCVLWLSIICATCFGVASSNAVLMSTLAKHIVGSYGTAVFERGIPFLLLFPAFLALSSSSSHVKCWQLIPWTPPTCKFFQFSGRIIQDAYHFDITDVSAIALQLLIPFSGAASSFLKKTNFTIFHELGDSIWPMTRS